MVAKVDARLTDIGGGSDSSQLMLTVTYTQHSQSCFLSEPEVLSLARHTNHSHITALHGVPSRDNCIVIFCPAHDKPLMLISLE